LALTPGTRLGPYEITAQIGVGGMGEVYRATDTNLKRQVAVKVLPATVAGDAERLARFQREAEVLAPSAEPVALVVPDGNWRQAWKVRSRVPGLKDVRCVTLPPGAPSIYRLRSEPHPAGLATIEAIARAMGVLEGPEIQASLEHVFRAMVERTLWARGRLATCDVTGGIPDGATRYRGVDWGETVSAYVVLWIAHVPGPPGLLISPECPNTIREMIAYRMDPDKPDYPLKENDHAPDVIRYVVTSMNLAGLVYVYREIYRKDSVAKGWTQPKEIEEIHTMSGWVRAPLESRRTWMPGEYGEEIEMTVCDRSWKKAIAEFNRCDIPAIGAKRIKGSKDKDAGTQFDHRDSEIVEGIRHVRALIVGTHDLEARIQITREHQAVQVLRDVQRRPKGVRVSLADRRMADLARQLLKRKERRR